MPTLRAERYLKTASILINEEDMRTMADYAEDFVLTEDDARATLRDAEQFVERMSDLLRER